MSSYVTGRLSWLSRKVTTILFAALFLVAALVFLWQQEQFFTTSPREFTKVESVKPAELNCQGRDEVGSRELWNAAQHKFRHLRDDKFTIAIQTYKRPANLNATLNLILSTKIPSLEEVVIVWNDLQTPTPPNFVSRHNVTVRYRMSRRNSLNEKFWPDPAFRTKAILLSDDDVHYDPNDLDFVFQTWRKNQHRLVGAFARCIAYNHDSKQLEYHFCQNRDSYSMILTGLAFTSVSFLDYYSSEDLLMTKIRTFVDAKFNCEDIALNFIASMLTCEGPLQVSGLKRPINEMPPQGISTSPDHLTARHKCVNDYTDMLGYIPLRNVTEFVNRGYFPG